MFIFRSIISYSDLGLYLRRFTRLFQTQTASFFTAFSLLILTKNKLNIQVCTLDNTKRTGYCWEREKLTKADWPAPAEGPKKRLKCGISEQIFEKMWSRNVLLEHVGPCCKFICIYQNKWQDLGLKIQPILFFRKCLQLL